METTESTKQRQGIQVIARAADILRTLEGIPEGLSLGDIAKNVGLPRSTVQRIVYALADEGFVVSATPNARVRLGYGLVSLGSAAKVDVDSLILPHMSALSKEVEETVDLSVQNGSTMVFIEQVVSEAQPLRAVSAVGNAFPIHCCANGKAVMASLEKNKLEKLFKTQLKAQTEATIVDRKDMLKELKEVVKTGVAYDREEHHEGICAIGVAIKDPYSRNLALSIPVPALRFDKNQQQLAHAILKYKDIIEKALGKN